MGGAPPNSGGFPASIHQPGFVHGSTLGRPRALEQRRFLFFDPNPVDLVCWSRVLKRKEVSFFRGIPQDLDWDWPRLHFKRNQLAGGCMDKLKLSTGSKKKGTLSSMVGGCVNHSLNEVHQIVTSLIGPKATQKNTQLFTCRKNRSLFLAEVGNRATGPTQRPRKGL